MRAHAYVMVSGSVEITAIVEDNRMVSGSVEITAIVEDNRAVVLGLPAPGEVFGFALMLVQTSHQTEATAIGATECIEVDLNGIQILLRNKPDAGLDLMTAFVKPIHAAERRVRLCAAHNPNDVIGDIETLGERIVDRGASFGGSWAFIFAVYAMASVELGGKAWDPIPSSCRTILCRCWRRFWPSSS